MKLIFKTFPNPGHEGIPGHQGGSLPRGESAPKQGNDDDAKIKASMSKLVTVDLATMETDPPKKYWITPQREIVSDTVTVDQSHALMLARLIYSNPELAKENGLDINIDDIKKMLVNDTYEDTILEDKAYHNRYMKVELRTISLKHPEKANTISIFTGELNSPALKKIQDRMDKGMLPATYKTPAGKKEYYNIVLSGFSGDKVVTIKTNYSELMTSTGFFIPEGDNAYEAGTLKHMRKARLIK
jgi:hypothetical protein